LHPYGKGYDPTGKGQNPLLMSIVAVSLTFLYNSGSLVTTVGQNDVTPCWRMPLATLQMSAWTSPESTEKSTPNAPDDSKIFDKS